MVTIKDKQLELQIEGMQVLARKLEPFLPRLTPVVTSISQGCPLPGSGYGNAETGILHAQRFSVVIGSNFFAADCAPRGANRAGEQ